MADTKNSWTVSKVCNKSLIFFSPQKEKQYKKNYFGKLTTNVNWSEPVILQRVLLIATNAPDWLQFVKTALLSQDENQSQNVNIYVGDILFPPQLLNTRKGNHIRKQHKCVKTHYNEIRVFKIVPTCSCEGKQKKEGVGAFWNIVL